MSRSLLGLALVNILMGLNFWILWPLGLILAQQNGLPSEDAGYFTASTWAGCLMVVPFLQPYVAKFGHRRVILASALIYSVASCGYAWAFYSPYNWLWAVLLGIALGVRWPALDSWAVELISANSQGRLLAAFEAAAGIPLIAGPGLDALLGTNHCVVLSSIALLCVIVSGVILSLIRLPPGREKIHQNNRKLRKTTTPAFVSGALIASLCGGLFENGFMVAGPLIASSQGFTSQTSLWSSVLVGIGSVTVQMQLGKRADRFGALPTITLCVASLTAAFVALSLVPSSILIMSAVIGGLGGGLYTLAAIQGVQHSQHASTQSIGIAAATCTIGSLLSPALTGASLAKLGPTPTIVLMAIISGGLLAYLICLSPTRRL